MAETKIIDTSGFRYSWRWKSIGWLLALCNLVAAMYEVRHGDPSGFVFFNAAVGGYVLGTLLERE